MTATIFYEQDCVTGMRALPAHSEDVCVTSPPYNLGIKYRKYKDNQRRDTYLKWTQEWVAEVHRLLKPNGSFFLNVGATPSNPMLPHEIVFVLREMFVIQNTFHWVKSISVTTKAGESLSVGHFKPIRSARFVNDCHEYIFHLTKTGSVPIDRLAVGVPYTDKSNIKRWAHTGKQDRRCRGNVWFIPYKTIQSRDKERPHPATFPPKLVEMCLRVHGGNRSTLRVFDPFVGIGNAAIAANDLDVGWFTGFEIDGGYLQTALEFVPHAKIHKTI